MKIVWSRFFNNSDTTVWDDVSKYSNGYTAKEKYVTRTVFIPICQLMEKGMKPEYLTAIAVSSMGYGAKVTIHSIDFVKAYYDKKVTSLEVTAEKRLNKFWRNYKSFCYSYPC